MESKRGLSVIEVMVVVAFLSILVLAGIWAAQKQLQKGRDAKRKGDLDKLQNVLEDYINDNVCYPEGNEMTCGKSLAPYLSQVPCDPIHNTNYNYFYSFDGGESCKLWYKIYAKLENEQDSIIEKVGCKNGCGPSNNYNYWVGSPNVTEVAQLPGEYWWPEIPGATPPPGGTPTLPPGGTPTPTPSPGVTPTPSPTPAPTGVPCGDGGLLPTCPSIFGVYCNPGLCSVCCPGRPWRCDSAGTCCLPDPTCSL